MASTRQIQIYHDADVPNDYPSMSKPRPQLQPSALPLQSTMSANRANLNQGVVFNPPQSYDLTQSPMKGTYPLPIEQSPDIDMYNNVYHNGLEYVPIMPTRNPLKIPGEPMKKPVPQAARPLMQPIMQQQQPLFTTFHSVPAPQNGFEKENYAAAITHNDNFAEFPDPAYGRKHAKKRSLDSAPIINQSFKKARQEDTMTQLPEPQDMPPIEDDGCKPNYSYAHLIGMAILRSPNRQLTLAQIYKWISDTFSFYQAHESGWQNSIRHNLSLNKAFQKKERPKDDPGKGNYWVIQPGMEMQFVKERPQRNKVLGIGSSQNIIAEDPMRSFQGTLKPITAPPARSESASHPIPALPELNSDETIPASDPALNEEENTVENTQPIEPHLLHSSPPEVITSSPPGIPDHENGTPEAIHFARPSSGHIQNRKRKVDMDDSGYFSSLESSAMRPNKISKLVTTEADKPRKKRGRAEEEIARIRSSSHDITPDNLRFKPRHDGTLSSSPLRGGMLPPATPTPGIIFQKPAKPPVSVSPNTNLRQHRQKVQELMASPTKAYGLLPDETFGWSPAFNIHDSATHDTFDSHFDIFADTILTTTPGFISPLKRSSRQSTVNRPNTSSGALGDITPLSSRLNARSARASKLSNTVLASGSPLKLAESAYNMMMPQAEETLFDFDSFNDIENLDADAGFDIYQGFQKIGDGDHLETPMKKRPGLGRSITSRF